MGPLESNSPWRGFTNQNLSINSAFSLPLPPPTPRLFSFNVDYDYYFLLLFWIQLCVCVCVCVCGRIGATFLPDWFPDFFDCNWGRHWYGHDGIGWSSESLIFSLLLSFSLSTFLSFHLLLLLFGTGDFFLSLSLSLFLSFSPFILFYFFILLYIWLLSF